MTLNNMLGHKVTKHLDLIIPENKFLLLLIIFFFKAVFFLFLFPSDAAPSGVIGLVGGDTESYFSPIENLLSSGHYLPDYRMPGYGWVYLVLRLGLNKISSYNTIIVLQWVISSISVYALAKTVYIITKDLFLFRLVFFSFLLSTATNTLDFYLLTESFTASSLIFSFYFLAIYWVERKKVSLFYSGAFMCWAIFLRPIMLPILLVFACAIGVRSVRQDFDIKKVLQLITLFCLPYLVCETMWIYRNFTSTNKIILLTTTQYPLDLENTYYNELMGFIIAWGGDRTWWNPAAEIRWFVNNENQFGKYENDLPEYIYTRAFNKDSLIVIKKLISVTDDPSTSLAKKEVVSLELRAKLKKYTQSIKEEKPFLFYFESKLIMLKKFIVHSGTPLLFNQKYSDLNGFKKSIKIFYSLSYVLVMGLGSLGALLSVRKDQSLFFYLFPVANVYLLLIYPYLGHFEYRYLVPTYPFTLVCACYFVWFMKNWLKHSSGSINSADTN